MSIIQCKYKRVIRTVTASSLKLCTVSEEARRLIFSTLIIHYLVHITDICVDEFISGMKCVQQ